MPLSTVFSAAIFGIDALPIEIEVDNSSNGKPHLVIVGLPDLAIKEAKDRIFSALRHSSIGFENFSGTVNLAPAALRKEGALYDLPMAIAMLQSLGKLPLCSDFLCIGELALSGHTRPFRGALAIALLAKKLNKKTLLLPSANAEEAANIEGIEVIGVETLAEACAFFQKPQLFHPTLPRKTLDIPCCADSTDFSDIQGQLKAKRALEIAAAGHHNILLFGPPGTGKTMLAKALRSILPPLSVEEAIEVTRIHSISGTLDKELALTRVRPFRSPHHSASSAALIGGGSRPKPGELTLAHHGVIFLDELPEFSRTTLEALRQPLEDRRVSIARAQGTLCFPTNCLLIAAMNPCPCGHLGHPIKSCRDSQKEIDRYRGRISGPLLERIDLHVEVPFVPPQETLGQLISETSSTVQKRVQLARERQHRRFGSKRANSALSAAELKEYAQLSKEDEKLAKEAIETFGLSMRSFHRLLKVARTIADLNDSDTLACEHFLEALTYRPFERQ